MEGKIVFIHESDVVVSTLALSKGFEVEHRHLKRLICKYKSEFDELGVMAFRRHKPSEISGGRPTEEYLLNDPQATYLTTLLQNNDKVRKFKMFLTKEFFRQRKLLMSLSVQRQNQEWLEKRANGKIERRTETDKIKEFIEYAKAQGSTSADKYYMIISRMENSAIFHLDILKEEFPNIREVVSGFALDILKMCDYAVGQAIEEGMKKGMYYKDIYKDAKLRVEMIAQGLGKLGIEKGLMVQFQQKQIA